MMNRTTCPNCGSEVEGWTLGYGIWHNGDTVFGCSVCTTEIPKRPDVSWTDVTEAACHVLGAAFVSGRIDTSAEDFAGMFGSVAKEIADRAFKQGIYTD